VASNATMYPNAKPVDTTAAQKPMRHVVLVIGVGVFIVNYLSSLSYKRVIVRISVYLLPPGWIVSLTSGYSR
jgi:hypothetical protein